MTLMDIPKIITVLIGLAGMFAVIHRFWEISRIK